MIHRLSILNRQKSVGITLFNDGTIYLQPDLLTSLVQALMMLGQEMGPSKGELREAELGVYQISILSRDHLAYVVVHDTYDSEPFTKKILESVIQKYHKQFMRSDFHIIDLKNELKIQEDVAEMLKTMKFPREKLGEVTTRIDEFHDELAVCIDTMLLSDLDDGIIQILTKPSGDEHIIRLLMEILSEIPFERHWIGQSKLRESIRIDHNEYNNEIWLIYRIGQTDFCIMGRAYYNSMDEYDDLLLALDDLITSLDTIISRS